MNLPAAIIFINSDLSSDELVYIKTQLFIAESMIDTEFNNRLVVDPNYPSVVHGENLRILVIKSDFRDFTNRQYADAVIFVKQGMAAIEKNGNGPPSLTLPIFKLNIWELLRGADSNQVIILPGTNAPPILCECDFGPSFGIGGIVAEELRDTSFVACRNPDNEYNNPDFINRK